MFFVPEVDLLCFVELVPAVEPVPLVVWWCFLCLLVVPWFDSDPVLIVEPVLPVLMVEPVLLVDMVVPELAVFPVVPVLPVVEPFLLCPVCAEMLKAAARHPRNRIFFFIFLLVDNWFAVTLKRLYQASTQEWCTTTLQAAVNPQFSEKWGWHKISRYTIKKESNYVHAQVLL